MKKIITISLIILALGALKAQAQVLSQNDVKAEICKQVIEKNKKYTSAEMTANVIALPFATLTIPDGNVRMEISSCLDKFMARDLKKVNVYVNDKFARTFNAPVEVKAYQEVLVASAFIPRDQALTLSMVTTKKMQIANNLEYVLTPTMLNNETITKKAFLEGEIIDKRFVKQKPVIQRNDDVKANISINNLNIELEAVALSDGMIGDYINVENKSLKRIYKAKVVGENRVTIQM